MKKIGKESMIHPTTKGNKRRLLFLSAEELRCLGLVVLIISLLSCAAEYPNDNLGLFKTIYESEQTSIPFVNEGKLVSVDKEITLSEGSVFIARLRSGERAIYTFWAMERDATHVVIWPFGGVFWGHAGERYEELLQRDSLPSLIDRGEWWKNDTIWVLISQDKTESFLIERDL